MVAPARGSCLNVRRPNRIGIQQKCWFLVEGGKPENTEKKPQSRGRNNNKVSPDERLSTEIELGSQK